MRSKRNPLKQGLRLREGRELPVVVRRSKRNPLKQGLRLIHVVIKLTARTRSKRNPLKQGLRHQLAMPYSRVLRALSAIH